MRKFLDTKTRGVQTGEKLPLRGVTTLTLVRVKMTPYILKTWVQRCESETYRKRNELLYHNNESKGRI
jgi:hypothetical protein